MRRKYYYLWSLVVVFGIPTLIVGYFVADRIPLQQLVIFVLSITLLGSFYDIWATRHGKRDCVWIWTFNHKDTIGIRFLDLPIEEYLFYTISSIYIVFIWEGIRFALETESFAIIVALPFSALWTMLFVGTLYLRREKRDKVR